MKKNSLHEIVLVGFAVATLSSVIGQPLLNSLLMGVVGSAACVGLKKKMKQQQKLRLVQQLEHDLPYALLELDVLLSLHWPFEQAIKTCIEQNPTNSFWEKMKPYFAREKNGTSHALTALEHEVVETNSVLLSQAVGHLQFIYQQAGQKSSDLGLKALATHALHQQRLNQQAFSKQLSFLAIIFVASSTIIPTLLQSFLLLGNLFLEISI